MIWDVEEQLYIVVNANFGADMTALVAAKGLSGLGIVTTADIIKRQRAEVFLSYGKGTTTPALGVYVANGRTQAKHQTFRQSDWEGVCDYWAERALAADGTGPSELGQQTSLAIEALLRSIDRLAGSGRGVYGGGEELRSVQIEVSDNYVETKAPYYWRRAVLRFPINDDDVGL